MAITQEQVLAAVEKYLPKTVNYIHSEDFGDRDPTPVFERIQQIVFTTLLVDQDAVFYMVYLASQRLLAAVDEVINELELLSSEQQLKGITGVDPTRIDDLSQLTAARVSLVRLSTSVVQEGTFGDTNLEDFQTDIEGFMETQVVPNVAGGNKAKISSDIRTNMASLKTSWANVLERRDRVFGLLDKYVDEDLRTRVSTIIITAIQDTLRGLEAVLPTLSTAEQAEAAESILVELAAAEAAITIIGDASSPLGVLVAGPEEDGRTSSSYLALEGVGRTEPVLPVLSGEDGALRLEGPNAGAPFTSLNAQTVGPGPTTDLIVDGTVVDFTALGIEAGMYLTMVDLGTSHQLTTVSATQLFISPKTPHVAASPQRYAITDHAPGRYFNSAGSSFWDVVSITAQTTVISPPATTLGEWKRINRVEGVDGTNVYASGTDGILRPQKLAGPTGLQGGSSFVATGANFLSNLITAADFLFVAGANSGGNPYAISVINTEDDLDIVATWGIGDTSAWYIESATAGTEFQSATGAFITNGTTNTDFLVISGTSGGLQDGTYGVNVILGQTQLTLLTAPLTFETSVTWELVTFTNDRLYSASVNFVTSGVVVGDLVDITGEGTFTVLEVHADYLRLSGALSGVNPTLSGLSFEVYTAPGTGTKTFTQTDGANFETLEVTSTLPVVEYVSGAPQTISYPALLVVDGVTYRVQSRVDATTLTISALSSGTGGFTGASTFVHPDATFQTDGVDPAKHELVVISGTNAGSTFALASVDSETQLTISTTATLSDDDYYEIQPVLASGLSWNVNYGSVNRKVVSAGFFLSSDVGNIFVWKRGLVDEVRIRIDSYVSANEVWLAEGIGPESLGVQPAAVIRVVKPGMQLYANSRRYTIRDIKDGTALDIDPKMSNAPGTGIDFVVMTAGTNLYSSRICDPVGAAELDAVNGFTDDYANATVHLMVDAPVRARYLQAYDPGLDGFAEAFQVNTSMRLGYRRITYQLLVDLDNQSNLFLAAETAPLPLEEDYLTVWGLDPIFRLTDINSATPDMELTISPGAAAKLLDQLYVIHRGGSQYFGRWTLYDTQNNAIDFDEDTDILRLKVAEVLIEFGELDVLLVDSGIAGVIAEDGDEDGLAFELEDPAADFSGAQFGDRIKVTYPDTHVETSWVSLVLSDTRVRFSPALTEGTALTWVLERNSVSSALVETRRLQQQMQSLQSLIEEYLVERNSTVDAIIDLLEDQRLTRAVDLLLDGKIDEFINLEVQASSYSTLARTSIQAVGSTTVPSATLSAQVAGVNPASTAPGASSASSASTGSISATTATSASSIDNASEDVDVRVAMARALAEIEDDETIRSLAFTTFEEQRNRAIYELCGIVESGFISDEDPTLPWITKTGSKYARVTARYLKARDAVQYMIDHPDEFDDIE